MFSCNEATHTPNPATRMFSESCSSSRASPPSLLLPIEIDPALGGARSVKTSQQGSSEEAGALTDGDVLTTKELQLKRTLESADSIASPRSLLDPQPSLASADSDASDRPSLPCRPQVLGEGCKSEEAATEQGEKCNAPSNTSERLRMVITDSDALQRKIREHLFLTQGRHMASSPEPADVYNPPASLDSSFRIKSMDSQIRRARGTSGQIGRASLDGLVCAQIGNAAVIRARNSNMPSFDRAALPPLATAAAKTALGLSGADSTAGTDAFCHVGGTVDVKLVSRSLVEDMMVPLSPLERSISDLINEA